MTKNNRLKTGVSLLLSLIFVISVLLTSVSATENGDKYDLSSDGSPNNKVLTSADILEDYLGERLIDAERKYLVSYGGPAVSYDDGITTADLSVAITDEGLSVIAYEYTYTSKNGVAVTWIPKEAILADDRRPLVRSALGYETVFEGVDESSSTEYLSVEFSLSVAVSAEDINSIVNKAYNDVPLIRAEIAEKSAEYDRAIAEYNRASLEYAEYLAAKQDYDEASAAYKQYQSAYRLYRESLDTYNEYLADLAAYEIAKNARETYEAELAVYNEAYREYVNYLVESREYEEGVAAYDQYVNKVRRFRACLLLINYTDRTMTDFDRSLRDAIYGTVVDTILNQRETLESKLVGAPSAVIDLAGEATESLRSLLNDYFSYNTEQNRYSFYLEHYEEIRSCFVNLFTTLDYLYTNNSVRSALYERGKDEKYRILVAQLYLIAHAINDGPIKSLDPELVKGGKDADKYSQFTYTSDYTMDVYEYTISDILGEDVTLTDTDMATPLNEPFPTEVICPLPPKAVEEPKEPAYVAPPAIVTPVDLPLDEPEAVDPPGDEPQTVLDPGEAPEQYIPPVEFLDLLESEAQIFERSSLATDDYILQIKKTVTKKFISPDEVNVKFYSHIGGELLYETVVDAGTAVSYSGTAPTKDETAALSFRFSGWQDEDGTVRDLSSVGSDLNLYPYFETVTKYYDVSFVVDGKVTKQQLPHGEMPAFDGDLPSRADTELEYFTFKGWDKEIAPVSSDVTYTAVFDSAYIVPASSFGATVAFDGENLIVNYGLCFDRRLELSLALARAESLGGIVVITPFCNLVLSYSAVRELCALGAHEIFVDVTEAAGDICEYRIEITDKNGDPLEKSVSLRIEDNSVPMKESSRLRLFSLDDAGERSYCKYSVNNGVLAFAATSHVTYRFAYEYTLTAAANDLAVISAQGYIHSSGESIPLTLQIPDGYKLTRLYYFDREGKAVELKTLRLTMPDFDTTLIAEVAPITYKITFMNGKVPVSIGYYPEGALPAVPEDPIKISDGAFDYTFVGWSDDISPAKKDVVYYAVYTATPVEVPEQTPKVGFFEAVLQFFADLFAKIASFFKKLFGI